MTRDIFLSTNRLILLNFLYFRQSLLYIYVTGNSFFVLVTWRNFLFSWKFSISTLESALYINVDCPLGDSGDFSPDLLKTIFRSRAFSFCNKSIWFFRSANFAVYIDSDAFSWSKLLERQRSTFQGKFPYSQFFWSVFSRIRTEYGDLLVNLRIGSECGKIKTRNSWIRILFTQ